MLDEGHFLVTPLFFVPGKGRDPEDESFNVNQTNAAQKSSRTVLNSIINKFSPSNPGGVDYVFKTVQLIELSLKKLDLACHLEIPKRK